MNTRRTTMLTIPASAAVIGGGVVAGPVGPARAYPGSCVGPVGAGNILQVREFSPQDAGGGSSLVTVAVDAACRKRTRSSSSTAPVVAPTSSSSARTVGQTSR